MRNTTLKAIGTVAVGAFVIAAPVGASAQIGTPLVTDQRTIRVSGVGEVSADPDMASVQFAVETTGATAQEAGGENADLMDRVIGALMEAGVSRDDIETTGYSIYPEYARPPRGAEDEPPVIRGYRASNQVSVETADLEGVGALIDAGLAAGANRLSGVSFELRNSTAAKAAALREAVEEARNAANTIASTLGVQLGQVLDASTSAEPVQPVFRVLARESMQMDAPAAAPTPIVPGEQTVRAVASVVFAIQ
ncbi:MAG: SIMPL domain-containing protein [Gemmatimonadota bacterium]